MVSSTNGVKGDFLDQVIQQVCKAILTVTFRDSYSHFKMKRAKCGME